MKRGTPNHPKLLRLQDELDAPAYVAAGILELLWHFTAQYAPNGAIGKWTNTAIARGIGWEPAAADRLIEALIQSGWLDESDKFRIVVHDWQDHCDTSTHLQLARNGELFQNGEKPSVARLPKDERAKLPEPKVLTEASAQKALGERSPSALPSLTDPSLSLPYQADTDPGQALSEPVSKSAKKSAGSQLTTGKRDSANPVPAATPASVPATHHGNGQRKPTAIGAVLQDTTAREPFDPAQFRQRTLAETADEITALTGEHHWRAWWLAVCGTLYDSDGGWGELCELVGYVRDCADPTARRRKDLGELKDPSGYLVKRVTAWMKERRLRWPAFPAKEGVA